MQVFEGAARLDDHDSRIVTEKRQGGPGAGHLPDQVAGLVIGLGILQGRLRSENSFSRLQLLFDTSGLPSHQSQCGRAHPQPRSGIQHRFRQRGQPVQNGQRHAAEMQADCLAFNQALSTLHIIGCRCMTKGFKRQAVAFIPFAGMDV